MKEVSRKTNDEYCMLMSKKGDILDVDLCDND